MTPENRIRELDAARGICILGMILVHLIYDLTELYPILHWTYPPFFLFLKDWGAIAFFLISGICVTLGRHHLRRGLIVLGCGILISAVTILADAMPIRFGVLHCLGLCMLLWHFFRGASVMKLTVFGIASVSLGLIFKGLPVTATYLYPLGLTAPSFESADFFPLLPYFGYFLLGALWGKTLYKNKKSLFPNFPKLSFLCFCGRHALFFYLAHQPILIFLIEAALASHP